MPLGGAHSLGNQLARVLGLRQRGFGKPPPFAMAADLMKITRGLRIGGRKGVVDARVKALGERCPVEW
jgi:hypothetical protein